MNEKFYTIVCHDKKSGTLVSIMASDDLSAGEFKKMKYIEKQLGKVDHSYPNLKYSWLGAVTREEASASTLHNMDDVTDSSHGCFYNEEAQMGVYCDKGEY